jgi:hypothetical protein
MKAGCYPADEEVEDFIFADGTSSALLTFQVPDTGLVASVATHHSEQRMLSSHSPAVR